MGGSNSSNASNGMFCFVFYIQRFVSMFFVWIIFLGLICVCLVWIMYLAKYDSDDDVVIEMKMETIGSDYETPGGRDENDTIYSNNTSNTNNENNTNEGEQKQIESGRNDSYHIEEDKYDLERKQKRNRILESIENLIKKQNEMDTIALDKIMEIESNIKKQIAN